MMVTIGGYFRSRSLIDPAEPSPAIALPLVAGSVLLVCLSYPLWQGRNWARITLFIVSLVACLLLAISGVSAVILESSVSISGSFSAAEVAGFRRSGYIAGIIHSGIVLGVITAQLFITAVLQHPDVVRAFRRPSEPTGRASI